MYTNYEILFFEHFIGETAKQLGKPVIYLRSYGWNQSKDVDKINASMELYKDILPIDIFTSLQQSEFVFLFPEDLEQALIFCEDSFPDDQADCELEQYIHYSLYNDQGQLIASN